MRNEKTVQRALDWLNFLLADVRGGFGPYLGIYLLTVQHWDQAKIGLLMTISGVVGLALQTPMGAFIDATRFKRGAIVAGVAGLALGASTITFTRAFAAVLPIQLLMEAASAILPPALAAITLGLARRGDLARRLGRNAAYDHAGNIFIAIACATVGWCLSQQAVFFLVPLCAALSMVAVLSIPASAIDHDRARGLGGGARDHPAPSSLRLLAGCKPLLIFATCAALFHFANAPMLQLVGQKLALASKGQETLLMSACIVAAQVVMLSVAVVAGKKADTWGRKQLLLAGFMVLPVRGVLYTLSDDRFWLLGVQLLDGIGAGLFSVLAPLVLADLMKGTGRFNLSLGALATVQGLGAALSSVVAGFIVVKAGYSFAFLLLAVVATGALLLFFFCMPETKNLSSNQGAEPGVRPGFASGARAE